MPDEVLGQTAQAMGWVTLNFCHLEGTLEICIWRLMGEPALGPVVTAELSFAHKLHLLGAFHKLREADPAVQQDADKLLREAGRVAEKRNGIVHAYWTLDDSGESMLRIKTTAKQRGFRVDMGPVSPQELDELANWIGDVEEKFREFFLK